jgi:hypothetical protein
VPKTVAPDRALTIVTTATNIGGNDCVYTLVLKVGGVVEALKEIRLKPAQREEVAFTVMRNKPGIYEIDLEGLRGSFRVA